jgi:hypothetical protein
VAFKDAIEAVGIGVVLVAVNRLEAVAGCEPNKMVAVVGAGVPNKFVVEGCTLLPKIFPGAVTFPAKEVPKVFVEVEFEFVADMVPNALGFIVCAVPNKFVLVVVAVALGMVPKGVAPAVGRPDPPNILLVDWLDCDVEEFPNENGVLAAAPNIDVPPGVTGLPNIFLIRFK